MNEPRSMPAPRLLRFALLALVLLALAACGRGSGTAADIRIVVDPPAARLGRQAVSARIWDRFGVPVTGAAVMLRGDMTHAGMEPTIARMDETGIGRYVAPAFELTMAGDWVLTVDAVLPDGRHAEASIPLSGVAP